MATALITTKKAALDALREALSKTSRVSTHFGNIKDAISNIQAGALSAAFENLSTMRNCNDPLVAAVVEYLKKPNN